MVVATLRHSIPKSIVYCQVREAKRCLLDYFFTELGAKEVSIFPFFMSSVFYGFFFQVNVCKLIWCKLKLEDIFSESETFDSQGKQLSSLLDEDPAVMQRRTNLAKRLELYRSAQAEIEAVAWSK